MLSDVNWGDFNEDIFPQRTSSRLGANRHIAGSRDAGKCLSLGSSSGFTSSTGSACRTEEASPAPPQTPPETSLRRSKAKNKTGSQAAPRFVSLLSPSRRHQGVSGGTHRVRGVM
jgi:hypothetical protein